MYETAQGVPENRAKKPTRADQQGLPPPHAPQPSVTPCVARRFPTKRDPVAKAGNAAKKNNGVKIGAGSRVSEGGVAGLVDLYNDLSES